MKTNLKFAGILAAGLMFAGTALASARPSHQYTMDGVILKENVEYLEPGREEKLDLYLPEDRTSATRSPAIVIIHGGGWQGGKKDAVREKVSATNFARAGYVCVSVEYMKDEDKRWPMNLHDCKNAVRWLRKNADELQVDADNIGVIGGSAGGHLALMVAYTTGVEGLEPEAPYPGISSHVNAVVNMYGITNLWTRERCDDKGDSLGTLRETATLFPESREEAPEKFEFTSPVNHVGYDTPPTLILHGRADKTVDRNQAIELATRLEQAGVEHELVMPDGGVHTMTLTDERWGRDMMAGTIAFFDRYLKPGASEQGE